MTDETTPPRQRSWTTVSYVDPQPRREIVPTLSEDGRSFIAMGTLTPAWQTDPVYITLPPRECLPIVFVPGIMGSNLRTKTKKKKVWRLDGVKPIGLFWSYFDKDAEERQSVLKPWDVEVDPDGEVRASSGPGSEERAQDYRRRGWGEVGEGSYHDFLRWLENQLNSPPDKKKQNLQRVRQLEAHWKPEVFAHLLYEPEIQACLGFRYPIYAVGYNWLDDNTRAAERLAQRIDAIIADNQRGYSRCEQVILITHSMGGLVARACAQRPGMADKIAGIVHGVMPDQGAPVAYRRCKVGMWDEVSGLDKAAAMVIGVNGSEVTGVFAQAPGALQLLPNADYGTGWLQVESQGQTLLRLPQRDPYEEIYKVRNTWWGLVSEQTLGGVSWGTYLENIGTAKRFHVRLGNYYHPQTHVYYGADPQQKSVDKIRWALKPGFGHVRRALTVGQAVHDPSYLEGKGANLLISPEANPYTINSSWVAQCDPPKAPGDGTVPVPSGKAPLKKNPDAVKQQLGMSGFAHEPAYHDESARRLVLHSIAKITRHAKVPK